MQNIHSAAILAGGRSSRMGQPKQTLNINGKTFLQIQTEKLLKAGFNDIIVSSGAENGSGSDFSTAENTGALPRCVRTVRDSKKDLGPLEGLRAVLEESKSQLCFVISVDAILVKTSTIRRLADLAKSGGSPITLLASPSGPEPLIGFYGKDLAKDAAELLSTGHGAVRGLFKLYSPQLLELNEGDPQLLNCNTPEDFKLLKATCSIDPSMIE